MPFDSGQGEKLQLSNYLGIRESPHVKKGGVADLDPRDLDRLRTLYLQVQR
jgi:hypothetical protein